MSCSDYCRYCAGGGSSSHPLGCSNSAKGRCAGELAALFLGEMRQPEWFFVDLCRLPCSTCWNYSAGGAESVSHSDFPLF